MNVVEMNQVLKTQRIRILDVFVLGPLMIHAANLIPKKHKSVRFSLMMFGATTIVYNGMNWHTIHKSLKNG